MNAIVRAIDVGFSNTKFVAASANGKVDCAHFASLAFFGHASEASDSMGGKVQDRSGSGRWPVVRGRA